MFIELVVFTARTRPW